jgi:ABC-type sugar transport system ATPase subunit
VTRGLTNSRIEEVTSAPPLLEAQGVHRRFGGVHALRGAELGILRGEIHGLVGANGSGKSTMLNILSGQILPDRGAIQLNGKAFAVTNPLGALRAGIAIVTQETTLVPERSVAENVLLGKRSYRRFFGVDRTAMREAAADILSRLGSSIDVDTPVSRLRPDDQQLVEIARAVSMAPKVLILDEPTSSLTEDEVQSLFGVMKKLRAEGVAIIFVTHRIREVFEVVDRVTVFRDGRSVRAAPISEFDSDGLIYAMAGEKPAKFEHRGVGMSPSTPFLRVAGLSLPRRLGRASFHLEAGEIVGLAGLVGAGRSELLEALFGLHPIMDGVVEMEGQQLRLRHVQDAISQGIAFVPSDRRRLGLVHELTVEDNLLFAVRATKWRLAPVRRSREAPIVNRAFAQLNVKAESSRAPVRTLSGGNQQKILLGRWLATSPRLMLLDEPTRGVDVHSKSEIYRLLHEARDAGISIIVSSSETPELLTLCDRILVMFRGNVVANLPREAASEATITHHASGGD